MFHALEFLIDGKRLLNTDNDRWDIFVSAYNDSDRVRKTYDSINAKRKIWWIIPEYMYQRNEYPAGETIDFYDDNEASIIKSGTETIKFEERPTLCFDITGMMRPQILFLLKYLKENSVNSVDLLYSEPQHYAKKVDTTFSLEDVSVVRQVAGYEGRHSEDMSNDVIVVGLGYDHSLVGRVIQAKESARVVELHSFPSLSADMYHESILRLDRASSSYNRPSRDNIFFSSANDPYLTASSLNDAITNLENERPLTNVYLSPLATKPQTVGFALYYLKKMSHGAPASIIFPFSRKYTRETATGVGRSWIYPVTF